jgi:hypothetical protein
MSNTTCERQHVPEGMTADKLREVADLLDIFDDIVRSEVQRLNAYAKARGEQPPHPWSLGTGNEVQTDLREWAEAIS